MFCLRLRTFVWIPDAQTRISIDTWTPNGLRYPREMLGFIFVDPLMVQ